MRLSAKIFWAILIFLVILYAAAYAFINIKGRAFIIKMADKFTGRQVKIEHVSLIPPYNLKLKGIIIKDLIKADSLYISPSILFSLNGKITLYEVKIFRPETSIEKLPAAAAQPQVKDAAGEPVLPALPVEQSAGVSQQKAEVKPAEKPVEPLKALDALPQASQEVLTQSEKTVTPAPKMPGVKIVIKHLIVENGELNLTDRSVGTDALNILVREVNLDATNVCLFPETAITNFDLKASIPWNNSKQEGRVEAEGWVNFFKKDMQATLKIKDIDGIHFAPYYSGWFNLEKSHIEKAKLNFTSSINSLHNDLTAACHFELTEVEFKKRAPDEQLEKTEKFASLVIGLFKAIGQGNVVLDFTIRTKMDDPQFSFGDIKMAVEDKISKAREGSGIKAEDVAAIPGKLLEGTVKGATDLTRGVISGTFGVGKELKDAVEAAFRRDPKVDTSATTNPPDSTAKDTVQQDIKQ
ncbi:MAG: DUF748 domain-containing protein [Candidatus Omnitrophota bacterium]